MRKTILIIICLVLLTFAMTACKKTTEQEQIQTQETTPEEQPPVLPAETPIQTTQEQTTTQTEISDEEEIPDISIEQCLIEIKQINPEMSDQEAQDNCYTIEAVNQNDSTICNQVSAEFRDGCLAMFE